jgi:hypothetical protein
MSEVVTDGSLPKFLGTEKKQIQWAKQLVAAQLGSPSIRHERPSFQGMFSRTIFLDLEDGREVVVQFRLEGLDTESFPTARAALGPVVPVCGVLENEELGVAGVRVYWMTRLPGKMWIDGIAGKGEDGRITICRSLGRAFSKGLVAGGGGQHGASTSATINNKIRPHLEAILASPQPEAAAFKSVVQGFLDDIHCLDNLPL